LTTKVSAKTFGNFIPFFNIREPTIEIAEVEQSQGVVGFGTRTWV